jgi:hypothetical protein
MENEMTDAEIMALAEKFAAHRDVREIELRGGAILEFVRAYNEACMRKWLESLPPKAPVQEFGAAFNGLNGRKSIVWPPLS